MNKVILMGRITREPEVRYSADESAIMVARYTLAVDRKYNREQQSADFINCIAFGRAAEFAEKYFHKGIKIAVTGRLQTGSYINKDGIRVYITDVIVEEQEFAESKATAGGGQAQENGYLAAGHYPTDSGGFMEIPDGVDDDLPFS